MIDNSWISSDHLGPDYLACTQWYFIDDEVVRIESALFFLCNIICPEILNSYLLHVLVSTIYEKQTNLGSRGRPSEPILFFANLASVCILLASLKFTRRLFMMTWISLLLISSRPRRKSPAAILEERSNSGLVRPFSISEMKADGRRE